MSILYGYMSVETCTTARCNLVYKFTVTLHGDCYKLRYGISVNIDHLYVTDVNVKTAIF
jgi:hypothetical protein